MKKVQFYDLSLAIEKSLYNAAEIRVQSFIKDNQDLQQRLQTALQDNKEKETQVIKIQKMLKFANQQRTQAEQAL